MIEFEKTRWFRILAVAFVVVVVGGAGAFVYGKYRADQQKSLVAIAGGGFVYYYRLGEIRAGITAVVQKPAQYGTRLTASFQMPEEEPVVVSRKVTFASTRYGIETGPLHGIEKDREYPVVLEVRSPAGKLLEIHERMLVSNVDPALVPDKPLTVGPGYHRNPDQSL